ncbi:hypothetical protein [Ekhidna sp.]
MSKKASIEDRVRSLEARERKIKLQLDSDSDELKEKAMRVGKIALIAGVVSILGYWIFNIIFNDDEEVEEKPKKKKKRAKDESGFGSRIATLAMPYLNKFLDGILEDQLADNKEQEERKD